LPACMDGVSRPWFRPVTGTTDRHGGASRPHGRAPAPLPATSDRLRRTRLLALCRDHRPRDHHAGDRQRAEKPDTRYLHRNPLRVAAGRLHHPRRVLRRQPLRRGRSLATSRCGGTPARGLIPVLLAIAIFAVAAVLLALGFEMMLVLGIPG